MVEIQTSPARGADYTDKMRRVEFFLSHKERIGRFFKAVDIAQNCGYPSTGTCPKLRADIELMNSVHKKPIVSTNEGFKWATNKWEVKRYAKELLHRSDVIRSRAEGLFASLENGDFWEGEENA